MQYPAVSPGAVAVFALVALGTLAAAWMWGRRRATDPTMGEAGRLEGLAAAWLVGICGLVAFSGYDAVLYAVGLLAGGIVTLLIEARPLRVADHLAEGNQRLAAAGMQATVTVAKLVVGSCLLTGLMVAAGSLLRPFVPELRAGPLMAGPLAVGVAGVLVVLWTGLDAVMPTAWRRWLQAALIVGCAALAWGVCARGLAAGQEGGPRVLSSDGFRAQLTPTDMILPNTGAWEELPLARVRHADSSITVWRFTGMWRLQLNWGAATFSECQLLTITPEGTVLVNNLPQSQTNRLQPAGGVLRLENGAAAAGALGPLGFAAAVHSAEAALPRTWKVVDQAGRHTVCGFAVRSGADVLLPGGDPTLFPRMGVGGLADKVNFVSLMLALVGGVAAWEMLSRTRSSSEAAVAQHRGRIWGVITVAVLGAAAFYLGLGALVGRVLEPTDSNLTLPLVARSFGEVVMALVAGVTLALVFGGAAALLRTVERELAEWLRGEEQPAHDAWEEKYVKVIVGVSATLLGMLCAKLNVAFLLAWGLGVAASTVVPVALLRFWRGATWQGMAASVVVGMVSSLAWILLSGDVWTNVYGMTNGQGLVPFNQPAIVALPLGMVTMIGVSVRTGRKPGSKRPAADS
jgi:cation/acetate symporter